MSSLVSPRGNKEKKEGLRARIKHTVIRGASAKEEDTPSAELFDVADRLLQASRYDEFAAHLSQHPHLSSYHSEKTGTTLLHIAAVGTSSAAVQQLLQLRSDPNAQDQSQRTPLLDAVQHYAPVETVRSLLAAKADPAYCANHRSVLHYASRGVDGNVPVLEELLAALSGKKAMEAVNYLLSDQEPFKTALDFAQNPAVRLLLIDHGAETGAEYIAQLRNEIQLSRVGEILRSNGYEPKYPLVMLPGTCSSALELWHSDTKPGWVGSRIWLDPAKLGLKVGLKNKSAEDIAFLEHMRLEDDGISDPPGISLRPVEGIHGIDYLMGSGPSAIKNQSVVWGEVITMLASLGYNANNLVGFSYDWRLAPEAMQKRDKIFTKLKKTVEYLREVNNERVALAGHSMGCKFGQFFLHWVEAEAGRKWIDENVAMFIAMGPPWAGAPKIVRALLSGDSMGLPTTFLFGTRYLVAMSRTFSSSLWLLPLGDNGKCVYFNEDGTFKRQHWNLVLPVFDENFATHFKSWYADSPYCFSGQEEEEELMRTLQAPYVDSLHCIYGVNAKELPNFSGEAGTEVGSYYQKRKAPLFVGNKKLFFKRNKASESFDGNRRFVKDGIVKERPIPGLPSGDGTVPYESLSWGKKWIGQPDSPTIKHYEFDKICHRETLLEPVVLHLLGELVCGGAPQEIHAQDDKVESVFSKPLEHVLEHLADENNVPYMVLCLIHSLRSTNSLSQKGILVTPGASEDVERLASVFLTWRKAENPSLNSVYPHSRATALQKFIQSLDVPLLSMDGFDSLAKMKSSLATELEPDQDTLEEMQNLVKGSKHFHLVCILLQLFHEVATNPVNEVAASNIANEYCCGFFWARDDKDLTRRVLACMIENWPEIVPPRKAEPDAQFP